MATVSDISAAFSASLDTLVCLTPDIAMAPQSEHPRKSKDLGIVRITLSQTHKFG